MKRVIFGFIFWALTFTAWAQYDISKSWEGAQVHVPGSFFTKSVDNVSVDRPLPTIVLMHGCGGIQQHEGQWAQFLKSQGYIVVLPNSYAIPGRVMNCDPRSSTPNLRLVPVNDLRPAEAEYTFNQLKKQSWVDQKNIFLMGHSEGGMAAAYTKELGFNAVIISSFICHQGVNAGQDTPILAISFETDPYFSGRWNFYCKDRWGDRPKAKQLILPGNGHPTYWEPKARQEVVDFIKTYTK